jgi:hypothetical protein
LKFRYCLFFHRRAAQGSGPWCAHGGGLGPGGSGSTKGVAGGVAGAPGRWSGLAFVWAKPRLCGAFLGPGAPQGKPLAQPGNLANSVALEPMALVLLAPFISAISAAAAADVAAAVAAAAAAAAAGESRCV